MSMTSSTPVTLPLRRHSRAAPRAAFAALLAVLVAVCATACSPDKLLGDKQLPPDVPDPGLTHTPAGALAAYRGALVQLRTAFGGDNYSLVPLAGLLTDELRSSGQPVTLDTGIGLLDSRFLPEDAGIGADSVTAQPIRFLYGLLQKVRGQSRQARGALEAYAPDSSAALTGHLDAVEGYADIFLADLFCSGIPLSTLDFGGDFTYQPGSSTEEVYQHAAALFDSALTLSADSARIMNLARVGKGRALLAQGKYAEAAAAVAAVPDGFQYTVDYSATASPGAQDNASNRNYVHLDFQLGSGGILTLADAEGGNGLSYLSSGDPRMAWVPNGTSPSGFPLFRPTMYALDGSGSIVLASGIEARLIQAEVALQSGDASWLTLINALRTDGTYDTRQNPGDSSRTDTLWHAGTGGVAGLAPLVVSGTPDERLNAVYQERAYWLFLTGHRQGDLRRLIRQYDRQAETVYPTGPYQGVFNIYGTDVTAPIPGAERVSNPLFTGCRSRGA